MQRKRQRYGGRADTELAIVVDCAELDTAAQFWCSVLDYVRERGSTGPYQSLIPADGDGIELLLQRVSDAKQQKNRLHLDLRTPHLEEEVSRLRGLGARMLTDAPVVEGGLKWHILADPDGNEFCVLTPSADGAASPS